MMSALALLQEAKLSRSVARPSGKDSFRASIKSANDKVKVGH